MRLLVDDDEAASPRPSLTFVGGVASSAASEVAAVGPVAALTSSSENETRTWGEGEALVTHMLGWCSEVCVEGLPLEVAVSLTARLGKLAKALGGLQTVLVGRIDELTAPPQPVVEPGMPEPKKQKPLALPGDHRDLPGLLEASAGQPKRTVLDEIRNAQAVRDTYPRFGRVIREGGLSTAYVKVLNRHIPPEMRPRAAAEEETLLALALANNPDQFAKAVRKWVYQHSPTEAEREAKRAALKQHLKIFPSDGGYRLSGWFTALNGLQLDKALRKMIGVPAQTDTRDHGQRCADALLDVLYSGPEAGGGVGPEGGGVVGDVGGVVGDVGGVVGDVGGSDGVSGSGAFGSGNFRVGGAAGSSGGGAIGSRTAGSPGGVVTAGGAGGNGSFGGPSGVIATGDAPNSIGRRLPRTQILVHVPLATLSGIEGAIESGCIGAFEKVGAFEKDGGLRSLGRGSSPPAEPGKCATSGEGLGQQGQCLGNKQHLTAEVGRVLGEIRAGLATGAMDGFEPATLEDGTAMAPSELATLLCDSSLSRIVLTAHGEPLDASRAQRTFSATQAKAVLARDRTCRYPNCNRGSEVSEIHHAQEWERGGATIVDNAVLLCWHHHSTVHANHVTITHHAGGFVFSRPDGSVIGVRKHESGRR
ncbi:MAG: DUF222 domain-containing protein [Ancrocorticia sp.]